MEGTSVTGNESHAHMPTWPIVVGVVLGIIFGHYMPSVAVRLKFLGEIFLSLLFVLVIPLVMSSMISGVSSLGNLRHLKKLGMKTLAFYMATTLVSVLTGLILVQVIQPGKNARTVRNDFPDRPYTIEHKQFAGTNIVHFRVDEPGSFPSMRPAENRLLLLDQNLYGVLDPAGRSKPGAVLVSTWVDENGRKVEPRPEGTGIAVRASSRKMTSEEILSNYVPRNLIRSMFEENIFSLILFSLIFGIVLVSVGPQGKPLIDVIEALNLTMIRCVMLLMYLSPIGIFGLIAGSIGEAELANPDGLAAELSRLAMYALTVLLGLAIHGAVTLVLVLRFLGGRNPFKFASRMVPQLLTAFSTASSMATLPVAMTLLTRKNRVSEKVADFVLPLGATINMDGTALYEGVAALYIAQVYNVRMGLVEEIIIVLTATIASIGAAAIPQAGLITLVLVLKSVGLPIEGIGLILSIDWFIDRCRTTVNSWGDVIGATVIDRFEKSGGHAQG